MLPVVNVAWLLSLLSHINVLQNLYNWKIASLKNRAVALLGNLAFIGADHICNKGIYTSILLSWLFSLFFSMHLMNASVCPLL